MSTTTQLSLVKPEAADLAEISVINSNMDTLDGLMASSNPTTAAMNDSPDAGTLSRLARSNHRHGMPGYAVPVAVGTSNSEGAATTLSRSDHVHQAATAYYNHGPETFDINAGTAEDVMVYVPSVPTSATLILRGRALVAGLAPAHTHSVTSNVSATTNSTGGESLTSGAEAAHTHTGTTAAGAAHTHTQSDSGAHDHGARYSSTSAPYHINTSGGLGTADDSDTSPIRSADHSHTLANESAHTHTITTAAGASHTHSATTANHSHTVTVTNNAVTSGSTGSGGFTATSRPAGVTVTIDGTDRTAALGGSFGTSGADWNEQSLNILTYISSTGWHTISLAATTGGRLKCQIVLAL